MRLALVTFLVFISSLLVAQPGDPNGGGKPGGGAVPLGGIEILIAAGALFGAKKALDKKST